MSCSMFTSSLFLIYRKQKSEASSLLLATANNVGQVSSFSSTNKYSTLLLELYSSSRGSREEGTYTEQHIIWILLGEKELSKYVDLELGSMYSTYKYDAVVGCTTSTHRRE